MFPEAFDKDRVNVTMKRGLFDESEQRSQSLRDPKDERQSDRNSRLNVY